MGSIEIRQALMIKDKSKGVVEGNNKALVSTHNLLQKKAKAQKAAEAKEDMAPVVEKDALVLGQGGSGPGPAVVKRVRGRKVQKGKEE